MYVHLTGDPLSVPRKALLPIGIIKWRWVLVGALSGCMTGLAGIIAIIDPSLCRPIMGGFMMQNVHTVIYSGPHGVCRDQILYDMIYLSLFKTAIFSICTTEM